MKHCGTQVIETNKLILRRFRIDDAEAMYNNWASDAEVTKYLNWPPHSSVATSQMVISEWIEDYSNDDSYNWAIVLKNNADIPIGGISVVKIEETIDLVEVGYCIGRTWWHQGITSEALKAVMDFMFDKVCANKVQAKHNSNNPNSGKVMKHCGMKYEGTLRSAALYNQGICDACYYGLLRSER